MMSEADCEASNSVAGEQTPDGEEAACKNQPVPGRAEDPDPGLG